MPENGPKIKMADSAKSSAKRSAIIYLLAVLALVIIVNYAGQYVFKRFDLTKEGRFSLTKPTKEFFTGLDDVVFVKVYLEGEFPAGFKRLRNATEDMLIELKSYAGANLQYEFIDPLADIGEAEKKEISTSLIKKGLIPRRLIENEGEYKEKMFFPGAIVSYQGRELPVILLEEQLNKGPQETINNSIALLEYKLANAVQKLKKPNRQRVVFLEGHGELSEAEVEDFAATIQPFCELHRYNLKNNLIIPSKYDVAVIAKPRLPFEEKEKFKIDQYIMNGGKVIWLVDQLNADMDSLMNNTGTYITTDYGLNLDDQLFKYGVRLNYNLIQDLQSNVIPLAVGQDQAGNATQLKNFPWFYYPVISNTNQNHPITKNINLIQTKFVSSMDTIRVKGITKTPLLTTSQYTKLMGNPVRLDLQMVREQPVKEQYVKHNEVIAVALEGVFESNFKGRLAFSTMKMIDSLEEVSYKEVSKPNKMIVISDGDIIKNEWDKKSDRPYPLGYYKYTNETFANKDFLINCIEWLMDDSGIIEARSKELTLRLLDTQKIAKEKTFWQVVNIVLPMILLGICGILFITYRKRKYTK